MAIYMCGMLNNILDDLYNLYVYYSQVECICQYWMYMYWCYIITYATLHNIVCVTVNYNKNVIIYMNIQMSIAIVPDIKANVQWYFR